MSSETRSSHTAHDVTLENGPRMCLSLTQVKGQQWPPFCHLLQVGRQILIPVHRFQVGKSEKPNYYYDFLVPGIELKGA